MKFSSQTVEGRLTLFSRSYPQIRLTLRTRIYFILANCEVYEKGGSKYDRIKLPVGLTSSLMGGANTMRLC
ncbi:hypothetical protein [Chamaesiphon sp. GL140_3_metabinner_50]|uniref:hypothetical protein n=1 Tax=Chamaesiphon sp. GL140_3_metabinner_50 TaxID=2970812 RepID=UPI0025FC41CA|nr:hypothetical protein [Chamaesiphon sp. GL140_3_metabinner_50]